MTLKLNLDSLEGIPEEQQSLYVQTETGYKLDLEDGAIPDVQKLYNARDMEKEEAKKAKAKYNTLRKQLESLGGEEGLAQLQELRQQFQDDDDLKLFSSGNRDAYNDRITQRVRSDYETKLQAKDKEIAQANNMLHEADSLLTKQMIRSAIREEASSMPDIVTSSLKRIERLGLDEFSLSEEREIESRGADGKLRTDKDGNPIGVKAWLEGLRESDPYFFHAPTGGSSFTSAGSREQTAERVAQMSQEEYIAARKAGKI